MSRAGAGTKDRWWSGLLASEKLRACYTRGVDERLQAPARDSCVIVKGGKSEICLRTADR